MRIGLHDADSSSFPNLALMKIAGYCRSKGDIVEWWFPMQEYDVVYSSKVFDFTESDPYLPECTIRGGTGYDITIKLPEWIEEYPPDYSIYPDCNYSLQLFSRGCIRKCSFCVVPTKEGRIREVKPMPLNQDSLWIEVLDNNFFANPQWRKASESILSHDLPVNFHGIDIRILTKEHCLFLNKLKIGGEKRSSWGSNSRGNYVGKQIKVAWDDPKQDIEEKLKNMIKYISPYKIMCYVLIGYNSSPKEDMYRVKVIDSLGADPFVMPFNKKNKYQSRFARWVNQKSIFKTVEWRDYK